MNIFKNQWIIFSITYLMIIILGILFKWVLNYFWTKKSFSWCFGWPPSTCRKDRAVVVGSAVCRAVFPCVFWHAPDPTNLFPSSLLGLIPKMKQSYNSTYIKGGLILESIFNSIPSKKWLKPDPTNLFSIIFVGAASKNETIIILYMY